MISHLKLWLVCQRLNLPFDIWVPTRAVLFSRKKKKRQSIAAAPDLRSQLPDASAEFLEIIRAVQPYTMTSPERVLALCNAVDYITQNQIAGSIVECGVWRGGSMAAVARTLGGMNRSDRELWLYDTFDGMSEPSDQDVDLRGEMASHLMEVEDRQNAESVWCRSPLDEVRSVMEQTGYPRNQIHYVVGKVEETLVERRPEKIAILRLDTDWYESTRVELEVLFPLMSPGGILIIDDYGHWKGCRRAVDEYFAEHQIAMMLNRIDYTGRIGVYCPIAGGKTGMQPAGKTANQGFGLEAVDGV